jgi:hypothetical protein
MASQWYYRAEGQTVGPVSSSELRRLALEGRITRDTRVRKGSDGEWVPAERVNGLFDLKAEWHFSQAGKKDGPVPFIVLQRLAASGKLSPTDLVWKEGMPGWEPATKIPGLWKASQPPKTVKKADRPNPIVSRNQVAWGGSAALLVVVVIGMAFFYKHRRDSAATATELSVEAKEAKAEHQVAQDITKKLTDAEEAIRRKDMAQAARLLREYVANPQASGADWARSLLTSVELATSDGEARAFLLEMSDEDRTLLAQGGIPENLKLMFTNESLREVFAETLRRNLAENQAKRDANAEKQGTGLISQQVGAGAQGPANAADEYVRMMQGYADQQVQPPAARNNGTAISQRELDEAIKKQNDEAALYEKYVTAHEASLEAYNRWRTVDDRNDATTDLAFKANANITYTRLASLYLSGQLTRQNVLNVLNTQGGEPTIRGFAFIHRIAPNMAIVDDRTKELIKQERDAGRYKEALSYWFTVHDLYQKCKELVRSDRPYKVFKQYE